MAKTKAIPEREATSGPRQARGRMVSRSIATNEQLGTVSLLADYLFRACIPFLDVTGRMTGNPGLIKAAVAPLREEIHSGVIPELLRELARAVDHDGIPLVFWYEINAAKVLEFPGFKNHQTGLREKREAASKFPSRNGMEKLLHLGGGSPDQLRHTRGVGAAQEEVEGEEEYEEEVVKCVQEPEERTRTNGEKPDVDPPREPQPTAPTSLVPSELLGALEAALGDDGYQRAFAFLQRRKHATWAGWVREMLRLIGPGSQFTPDDLARVCDDDAALEEPITGPFALRSFLATQRRERLKPPESPNTNGARDTRPAPNARGSLGEATYAASLAALADIPDDEGAS